MDYASELSPSRFGPNQAADGLPRGRPLRIPIRIPPLPVHLNPRLICSGVSLPLAGVYFRFYITSIRLTTESRLFLGGVGVARRFREQLKAHNHKSQ